MADLYQQIEKAAGVIRQHSTVQPRIAIILGTGLGGLANDIEAEARIPYENIPGFPSSTVETHSGELIMGTLSGVPVVALSGRFHAYEGYTLQHVTFPVRVAKALGVDTLIVSNAAGGLNPQFTQGDIMVITDHINFMGDNPLVGENDERLGPRFPDMSEPYSKDLVDLADQVALDNGLKLQRGVYLAVMGPCLETRAEYRMMRAMGADAVGMSTVPEVIVAVHTGLKVLGFSAVTDMCLPDALAPANIDEIIATANAAEPKLTAVVRGIMAKI